MASGINGHLPIVSVTDLIIFKIKACQERRQGNKRVQDAQDAVTLLETYGRCSLNSTQRAAVTGEVGESRISAVANSSGKDEAWWHYMLGLSSQRKPSPSHGGDGGGGGGGGGGGRKHKSKKTKRPWWKRLFGIGSSKKDKKGKSVDRGDGRGGVATTARARKSHR